MSTCKICFVELTKQKEKAGNKYCSAQCYYESIKGQERKTVEKTHCLFCKKEMTRKQSMLKRKFCSRLCQSKNNIGKPAWNKGLKIELSPEEKAKKAITLKKVLASFSEEKKAEMKRKAMISRAKNGIWKHARLGNIGEKDPCWKGEETSVNGKHRWIQLHWEKTGICEECGERPISKGRNKYATHWSNNDHLYKRDREDWQELCPKCHYKKDKELRNNN